MEHCFHLEYVNFKPFLKIISFHSKIIDKNIINKKMLFRKVIKNFFIKIIFIFFFIFLNITIKKKKRIGVISVRHEVNIGNNLLKYAIFIKLSELGFIPYIIGTHWNNYNISFINRTTNLIIIKNNFSEIKQNDYDILMVNSDQTWRRFDEHFYDYAFLNFTKNWKIKKFIYGASLGFDYWTLTPDDEKIAKYLLKNFNGISVREKDSIELIKKHIGVHPLLVLDPTLLIDKKYYLNLIKYYKSNNTINNKYIFIYSIGKNNNMKTFMKESNLKLNYTIYEYYLNNKSTIEEFIYHMTKCSAVITNSYHGTIFSILFNKPFVTFCNKNGEYQRFLTLEYLFGIEKRIFDYNQNPNCNLLMEPLKINYYLVNKIKKESIKYIKINLGLE